MSLSFLQRATVSKQTGQIDSHVPPLVCRCGKVFEGEKALRLCWSADIRKLYLMLDKQHWHFSLRPLRAFATDSIRIEEPGTPIILHYPSAVGCDRCPSGVAWRHDHERPRVRRVDGIPIR